MEPLELLGWSLLLAINCLFLYGRPTVSWIWHTNPPQPKKSGYKRFPWHRRRSPKYILEQPQLQSPPTTSPPINSKNNKIPPTQSDPIITDCTISCPNKIKKVKKSKISKPPPVQLNHISNISRKSNKPNKQKRNQRRETLNSSQAISLESPPILNKTDKIETVATNQFTNIALNNIIEFFPCQKFEVKATISNKYSSYNNNIQQVPKYTPWAQIRKPDLCFNHLDPYKTEAELLAQHNRYLNPKVQKIRNYQQHLLQIGGDLVSGKYDLLIAVDATPRRIGGYCINARTHECYYYSYPSDLLPWKLEDKSLAGNSAEFEMKNLQFALLLWEDEIRAAKYIEVHSDNLLDCNNSYGAQVMKFMNHIQCCLEVKIRFKVTPSSCVPEFARLIQPADDLSRKNVVEATQFLQDFYSLVDVKGAYNKYRGADEYINYLGKVHEGDRKWRSKRCYCGFHIDSRGLGFGPRLRPGHGSVYFH